MLDIVLSTISSNSVKLRATVHETTTTISKIGEYINGTKLCVKSSVG